MTDIDLQKAVLNALKHYNDLQALQVSPLSQLDAISVPSQAAQEVLASHATGLAVRRLLDQAIKQLSQTLPEAAELLDKRFRKEVSVSAMSKTEHSARATLHKHINKATAALTATIAGIVAKATEERKIKLYRQTKALPAAFSGPLVGFESYLAQMGDALRAGLRKPNLLVVTGLGGIGKTSLTCEALRKWLTTDTPPIERVLWATVEQSNQWAEPISAQTDHGLKQVLWQLGSQLELPIAAILNNQQRLKVITSHLLQASQRFVIVIDNVETPAEVELALAAAEPLLPLAQVLITSRRDIYHNQAQLLRLRELSEQHALELLRSEAQRRGYTPLLDNQMQQLYREVGGHPLALKLVAGQVSRLPVTQVLDALHRNSPLADELYTHVYETSWRLLSDLSREVLLALMLLPISGSNWKGLRLITPIYDDAAFERAIMELSTLNLLQVFVSPEHGHTYSLHRLTYCFLEHKTGMVKQF